MMLETSPAVHLMPPGHEHNGRWIAEDIIHRRRFGLSTEGAFILLASHFSREREEIVQEASLLLGRSHERAREWVAQLSERGLLLDSEAILENPALREYLAMKQEWTAFGWPEAAEYVANTHDYPFIEMADERRSIDSRLMRDYSLTDLDTDRSKSYPDALSRIAFGPPSAAVASKQCQHVFRANNGDAGLNRDILGAVLSQTFGKTQPMQVPWHGAPLIRRTSPSGGARHPTEAYVCVLDVEPLESGWYHFASETYELELIGRGQVEASHLTHLFPGAYARAPFRPRAIVVLTSVFGRNMFRYREPRTFRTVHMDVGHLLTTLELCAVAYELSVFTQYMADDEAVEKQLGLHGLQEGYMASMALC